MGQNEDEFTVFVQQEWASLYRTAYLIVADHGTAEDLVAFPTSSPATRS